MKKWKILFNIIMETVIFFGIAVLLIIGIPKLMGFFWPFVASWILALLATPLCNFLEKHIKLNKKWSSAGIIVLVAYRPLSCYIKNAISNFFRNFSLKSLACLKIKP